MKTIYFNSEEFLPSLALANSIVLAKNNMPILDNVRIETKDNGQGGVYAELMTSDAETWLELKAPVGSSTDVGIAICVDVKDLLQALRNLGGKNVTMSIDDEKHTITCDYGNGHFSLPFENVTEYLMPNREMASDAKTKAIRTKKMMTAIERAGFAVANDELRPVMNGIHFDFLENGMVAVATDGRKLAKYTDKTIENTSDDRTPHQFTMPKKPCTTLLNVLGRCMGGEDEIKVVFDDRRFVVDTDKFTLTARIVEGRYPNYEAVIPKDNDRIITIPKADFISALKRVIPLSNSSSQLVVLTFSLGMVTITAEDFDFSKSATENVNCDYAQGEFAIGFNGGLLLQLVQSITTDCVKMKLKDPSRAGIVCEDKENTNYDFTSLLMPMLINT